MALPEDGREAQTPGESGLRSAVFSFFLRPGGLHQAGVGFASFYPCPEGDKSLEEGFQHPDFFVTLEQT